VAEEAHEPVVDVGAAATAVAAPRVGGGVDYHFPVEVEVRTTVAAADVDALIEKALASLVQALTSA
jgi:hypothetical protein